MRAYIGKYPKNSDKERKIDIRVDDYDLWNADNTMALFIVAILTKFKDHINGIPCGLLTDEYMEISSSIEFHEEDEDGPLHKKLDGIYDECLKNYKNIIDEIIFSFTSSEDYSIDLDKEMQARKENGRKLFIEHFDSFWN